MSDGEGIPTGGDEGQENQLDEFDLDYTGEPTPESDVQNLNSTDTPPADEDKQEATPPSNAQEQPAPGDKPLGDGEEDDVESLRRQLAEVNLELLQLKQAGGKMSPTQPAPAPTSPAAKQEQPAPPAPQSPAFPQMPNEVSNLDFIGQDDHIKLLESRESFNALLNKVATVAYNAAVTASQERILRQIPQVVETTANQQMQIRDIVSRFYSANSDLELYKPAVSMAAIKLHNENASMPLEELLNKAAEETRRVLRIRPGAQTRPRVPAQPVGGGRVGGDRAARPANLSEQEQQILDLLS